MTARTRSMFLPVWLAAASMISLAGCAKAPAPPTEMEKSAIADTLKKMVVTAYDLSKPDVVGRLMSLYPPSGAVVSASGGHVTYSRAELEDQIRTFWKYVGSNMKEPKWEWTSMRIDVLSRDAAIMTTTYRIPHKTPMGMAHVIGGAWTALFERRNGRWFVVNEALSDSPNP